ncbi:MAG: hypothetical protein KJ620_10030 [Candidatus Edwardsbacteria bacterium]|nr:hypothetical protein [Candidatus Edwardsbacteria bacterium]MBU1577402.1 hypothetical protein [Candidatus Edwardsbacteria bacterium]MBU2462796.1 hypothetical protein [Candidatus Edwardsbacteria bacterium]MBU2592969.1 hypothetical protein [Candidatus Edwardsbacteria bacterium]
MIKNNILWAALILAALAASCAGPISYLPEHEMIGEESYGSYIEISTYSGKIYAGELIAVGDSGLVVREEIENLSHCFLSPLADIKSFSIRYANGKNYGWAVPLYTLGSLSHGMFFIFTAPINLIATTVIAVEASQAYEMNSQVMTFAELKLFARFPQGLPEGITLEMIK